MPKFVRVTDEVKPRREYSVVESAVDPDVHTVLDKPAAGPDGSPLPAKYTPESLAPGETEQPTGETEQLEQFEQPTGDAGQTEQLEETEQPTGETSETEQLEETEQPTGDAGQTEQLEETEQPTGETSETEQPTSTGRRRSR